MICTLLKLKVSVCMITYNHAAFITQAVESALTQQVDFDYEIVVGEDCSTDNTRSILLDLQRQHPSKIRLLLRDKNLGMMNNFVNTLKACQGHYVAILEGDDLWTSSDKLQKQVNFLDSHPDCTICFHNTIKILDNGDRIQQESQESQHKTISTLKDLLVQNFIPACSTMFRNNFMFEFPDWFFRLGMGDWPLDVLIAQYGNIGYIDEIMAAYRIHQGGLWSSSAAITRLHKILEVYSYLNAYLLPDSRIGRRDPLQ